MILADNAIPFQVVQSVSPFQSKAGQARNPTFTNMRAPCVEVPNKDSKPFLAVDVGNNRVKVGAFSSVPELGIPQPAETWALPGDAPALDPVVRHCAASDGELHWWIGSVNRPTTARLLDWLREHRPDDAITLLASGDLPLKVDLPRPDMVGIDRLLAAVAANRIRSADRPAVIVDLGTAVTVDLVSADGAFQGGAILPGIEMSARALHDYTDLLPRIEMSELLEPPEPLGKATEPAMRSGLYWGTIGAVRELTSRMISGTSVEPELFVTGGAGPMVARLLSETARHLPHLTLAGIALTAASSAP
jgi:type III pantothenate kinase